MSITILLTLALDVGALDPKNRPWPGDPVNGKKLYVKECAACHGDDGRGGKSGVSLSESGRMTLLSDQALYDSLATGAGTKKPAEHSFKAKLGYLELWDLVADMRMRHLSIPDFFPDASRYVAKEYTIDKFGLERIKAATSKDLKDAKAAVFTFFTFEGEDGTLTYVPQDPIQLDQLKKTNKSGYLVFLPFAHDGYDGELGIGMDQTGKIHRLLVFENDPKSALLNKSLSRLKGLGKLGQREPFKVAGGPDLQKLADAVFPLYLRAMESATMYIRDEKDRTWAEDD